MTEHWTHTNMHPVLRVSVFADQYSSAKTVLDKPGIVLSDYFDISSQQTDFCWHSKCVISSSYLPTYMKARSNAWVKAGKAGNFFTKIPINIINFIDDVNFAIVNEIISQW